MLFVVIMMFFDILLSILELVYYSRSECQDNQNHAFVYINFIFAFVGKLVVFNFINLEVSGTLPFEINIPFLCPILLYGMFPSFQLPQFIYDYVQCKYRSPLFNFDSAYGLMTFSGVSLLVVTGGACFLTLCFNEILSFKNRLFNCAKGVAFLYMKLYVIVLNLITLLLTFSQIHSFLPALFIENVCFWFLFLVAFYLKCCKTKNQVKNRINNDKDVENNKLKDEP